MKRFSEILESYEFGKTGNEVGLTNKYTPISNIITNVKNLFGATYNIVVTPGIGNSIELRCSRWINTSEATKDLTNIIVGGKSLTSYIYEQGLTASKMIAEGQRIVVVFYAPEIKDDASTELGACPDATCYTDSHANESFENEILKSFIIDKNGKLIESKEDDIELEDETPKEIRNLITSQDKVKAVEKFAELMNDRLSLPAGYYWKAVKDKDGNESIALRHKIEKRRPFGKTAEVVDSVLNIYGIGDEAIWVDGWDDEENIPEDVKALVNSIMEIIGAQPTTDPCVWMIEEPKEDEDDNLENNTEPNIYVDDKTI